MLTTLALVALVQLQPPIADDPPRAAQAVRDIGPIAPDPPVKVKPPAPAPVSATPSPRPKRAAVDKAASRAPEAKVKVAERTKTATTTKPSSPPAQPPAPAPKPEPTQSPADSASAAPPDARTTLAAGRWYSLLDKPGIEGFGVPDAAGNLYETKWRRAGETTEHEGRAPDTFKAAPPAAVAPAAKPMSYQRQPAYGHSRHTIAACPPRALR